MRWLPVELHNPWLLLLALPALGILYWRHRRRRGVAAIVYPTVIRLKGLRPTFRQRARILVPFLEMLAILGLVTAAARPRQGRETTIVSSQGIAIEMVLDRSSSMEETMRFGSESDRNERKKMDIVKEVFQKFVAGGEGLKGRKTDLIGLTTFARFTEESCPLIVPHEPLLTSVKNLRPMEPALDPYDQPVSYDKLKQKRRDELQGYKANPLDATAIGDGLQRAVLSLITAEEDLKSGEGQGAYKIKGKVAILLTDGQNNSGEIDPVEAGKYAAANGIRIYYVLFSETTRYENTIFGRRAVGEYSEDELLEPAREVVKESGGKAFLARSGEELQEIYTEIDQLERAEIGKIEYTNYTERYHWFLLPALGCMLVALFLGETLFRGIP